MCVGIMPRRNDISNDLGEAIIARVTRGRPFSNNLEFIILSVKGIIHKSKTFKAVECQGRTVQCSEKFIQLKKDFPSMACWERFPGEILFSLKRT